MFVAHVGPVDIVRAEDEHALEILAAEIDRHHFADQLAGAVGIARVGDVRYGERRAFVGRHLRRRLVNFGARGEHEPADAVLAGGVDYVEHAAHADIEHKIGLGVEEFRAVDEGEMVHFVDAFASALNCGGIADIAGDEVDVVFDLDEPARMTARVVVENAHGRARAQQRLDQSRAEEARSAGDEDAAHGAASRSSSAPAMAAQAPVACERRAASIIRCTR